MIWTTKDGRKVHIFDMEDAHLLNTIKFVWRRREEYRWAEARQMSALAAHCSEAAQDAMSDAAGELGESGDIEFLVEYSPLFYTMLAEAARRNLEVPDEILQAVEEYLDESYGLPHIRPTRLMKMGLRLREITQMEAVHLRDCDPCRLVYEGYFNDSRSVPASLQSDGEAGGDSPLIVNSTRKGGC